MTTNPLHEKLIEEMFDTEYMTGKQPNLTKEFARTTFLQIEQATREELKEIIGKHNARILNQFQIQGTPEMPMIAYDERVCLIPAITKATEETLATLTPKDTK